MNFQGHHLEALWDGDLLQIIGRVCPHCHKVYPKTVFQCETCPEIEDGDEGKYGIGPVKIGES
jgi:hypothetical protein